MMLLDHYFETIEHLYERVRTTQRDAMIKAGKLIADAAAKGNCIHIADSGHIINAELIDRGGGLMLWRQFKYRLFTENPVRPRDRSSIDKKMTGLAEYALRASGALPGDVIIIGSVSGKNVEVVDLAIEAKKFGMSVIVLTSLEYSKAVDAEHPSGKHLFDCGDIVIDNCAPIGDAMMDVEGLDAKLCPASGLAGAFIMWSITTVATEEFIKKGLTPGVYKSYNFPGGYEHNDVAQKQYRERGY